MWAISTKEFQGLFKSIRSIIIILSILGVSYGLAHLMEQFETQLTQTQFKDGANSGIIIMLLVFGPLFVSSLSHGLINQEVKSRTMRFLATKASREHIILGKFLGVCLFWFTCITASFFLIALVSHSFSLSIFFECILFSTCIISLVLMISTLISNPAHTMFFTIVLSVALPAISIWSIFSSKLYITWFKYITPYYYIYLGKGYILILLVFVGLFITISLLHFKRREL
ncbi:ABC transporter permease [Nitratireductor sp. DP7N14-4]|nr:ABC transporter permease [Nitratireductor sp. DP7N14-4]